MPVPASRAALIAATALLALVNTPAAQIDPDSQHVWVHYDYMVFPKGWTSLAGVTYPNGLSMAPSPAGIQKVVDAFAAQGLTLHIDPIHNAIPGHQVLFPDFDAGWSNPGPACVGPDAAAFLTVKNTYFKAHGNHPWHYAVFAFNAALPDTYDSSACPPDPSNQVYFNPLSTGLSELPGFNFIVSLGADLDQGFSDDDYYVVGTFMHELGHNFGLEHGGIVPNEEFLPYKPNYISVMNYQFQHGIYYAASLGSVIPVGRRLDYSGVALASLNEGDLNEFAGVNAGTTDIVVNNNIAPPCTGLAWVPAQGPIDWNCNGTLEAHASADMDNDNATPNRLLHGFDDWSYIKQQLQIPPDVIDHHPKRLAYDHR